MPKRTATSGRWTPTRSLIQIAPFVWAAGACAQIVGITATNDESAAGRGSAGTAGKTGHESGGAGGSVGEAGDGATSDDAGAVAAGSPGTAGVSGTADNAGAGGRTNTDNGAGMGGAAALAGMGGVVGIAGSAGSSGSVGVAGTAGAGIGSGSCMGLASTCGPLGDRDCCASSVVPGGTFNRSNDVASPATVSEFRLDTYEITVGRFRKFVAAFVQPPAGSGKNPNNSSDTGWDATWNTDGSLDMTAASLVDALKCNVMHQTWTDSVVSAAGESLPIDCLDWYEAEAFCIWDGGRLPTEAEWNYAASGGAEQRAYPWSNPPSSTTIDATYAVYNGLNLVAVVGSKSPKGDGKWGQSDLAGNILEWVQDYYATPYPVPCANCADLSLAPNRTLRGGSSNFDASNELTSYRDGGSAPFGNGFFFGARCARSAP